MRFNFKKISAMASSILLTGMTLGVAAAASYPAPFVVGSNADVAVVYGTGVGVSNLDQVEATNIQTDLESSMTGTGGDTVISGDSMLIAKSSDNINLGDTLSVFTGTVDDTDLSTLLADGTYVADDNDEFDFEQSIKLGTPAFSHFRDSDYEDEIGLDDRTPALGFKLSSNTWVLNYTMDFIQDAESSITSGDLDDIEGSDVTILGTTYYVSDLVNGSTAGTLGKLTLLDSAVQGTVGEGETISVVSGGQTYEVSINYIDNDEVRFTVNGESAPSSGKLQQGQSFRLSDDSYIGVRDISKLEVSGETGSVTFSIGAGKLEITSGSDIKLNDDAIDGVKGWVYRGTASGNSEKIDKIELEWKTDEEEFVTPESELVLPGFESVKLSMSQFVRSDEEQITIEADSDTSIIVDNMPLKDGDVSFNILYANSTGEFQGLGKASDERLATSPNATLIFHEKLNGNDFHEYFVASYNITAEAQSYLLRAKITYDSTDAREEVTIDKYDDGWVAACEEERNGTSCSIGDVSFTVVTLAYASGGNETMTLKADTNVNFNSVYTAGGLKMALPFEIDRTLGQGGIGAKGVTAGPGWVNFTGNQTAVNPGAGHNFNTVTLFLTEEDKDDNIAAGNAFNFTLDDNSDNNVYVKELNHAGTGGPLGLENGDSKTYEAYINGSDIATKILHYTTPDEDYAEIYYPSGDSESFAEVYLTESAAVVSTTGSALGDIVVKDSEVSSVSSKNLIIVGGSCINSAAATVLGGSYCGAAFTESTGVGTGEFLLKSVSGAYSTGKIALVVAGYESADTVAASTTLRTQTIDTSKSYTGTTSTQAVSELSVA